MTRALTSNKLTHVYKATATADTDTELIADPGDGYKIAICGIYISSDVAQSVLIEHGSTALHKQYVPANGGSIAAFQGAEEQVLWTAAASTSVTYTNSVAGNLVIEAWYRTVVA